MGPIRNALFAAGAPLRLRVSASSHGLGNARGVALAEPPLAIGCPARMEGCHRRHIGGTEAPRRRLWEGTGEP